MKPRLPHPWIAGAVLICAAAGFIAVARTTAQPTGTDADLQQADRSNPPPSPSARVDVQPLPQSGNPLWMIHLKELSETRKRPIFSPSRRPPLPPVVASAYVPPVTRQAPKPAEPERPTVSLVGTVASKTEGIGIFMEQATRDIVRLHVGEDHKGWVLRSVDGREAMLEKNGNTAVLELPPPGAVAVTTLAQTYPSSPPAPPQPPLRRSRQQP